MSLTRYRHCPRYLYWTQNGHVMGYKKELGKRIYFGGQVEDVPRRVLFKVV